MEYEAYEPDPEDEYYDQMCSVVYSTIFSEGSSKDENCYEYYPPVD